MPYIITYTTAPLPFSPYDIMASAKFWGGPKVSQFPSVPFYGLAMAFWISGCGAFVVTKNAAMKGYNSYDNTRQRQGEIVDAKYVGLGFWKIKYMFKNGPKIYVMNQLSPGMFIRCNENGRRTAWVGCPPRGHIPRCTVHERVFLYFGSTFFDIHPTPT